MANYDSPGLTYDSGVFYDAVSLPQPTRKKMAKVKLNLDRLSITDLIQRGVDIKTAMTGNANFTSPIPSLTNIGTLITALTTNNNTYESGQLTQKTNLTNRDNAAAALVAGLTQLGGWVEAASAGDEAVQICSSLPNERTANFDCGSFLFAIRKAREFYFSSFVSIAVYLMMLAVTTISNCV